MSYTVSDQSGQQVTADIMTLMGGRDDPRQAVFDESTTPEDMLVVVPVVANDIELNGDEIAVVSVTQFPQGNVEHDGATVTFTPNRGFFGRATFSYEMNGRYQLRDH